MLKVRARSTILANAGALLLASGFAGASLWGQVQPQELGVAAGAGKDLLGRLANLVVDEVPLGDALNRLQMTSGVPLAYSPMLLPVDRTVSCACRETTVADAVATLLRGTGFEAVVLRDHLVVRPILQRPFSADAALVGSGHQLSAAMRRLPRSDRPGELRGHVVDATTLAPIGSAQVTIPELQTGTISRNGGVYELTGLPPGTYTVHVSRIGHRPETSSVTIVPDEAVQLGFSLKSQPLSLDEVVVTGTPGRARLRAIGNSVGRLDAAAITELSPIRTVQNLIGPREPGVTFNRSTGIVGGGSEIRIRGTSTFGLSNQPLVYVDGVRVANEAGVGPDVYDGRQATRLDDFNPDDIQSVEIIKGPAAATLYGTEASAGVIQIITKKGIPGAPEIDVNVQQGANWLMNPAARLGTQYGRDRDTGEILTFNIWDEEAAAGRPYHSTGHFQAYGIALRGGTDAVRYYLAAEIEDAEGMVDYNWDRRLSFRANVGFQPSPTMTVDVSTGYLSGTTSFMQARTSWGLYEQSVWANPADRDGPTRGFMAAPPEEIATIEALREFNRFTGGITATHDATSWLRHWVVLGTDIASDENRILVPRHPLGADHFFASLSLGELTLETPMVRNDGLDYAATATFQAGDAVTLKTSYGLQYHNRVYEDLRSVGWHFPSPAFRKLSGAAKSSSTEEQTQTKTLGMYLQQEVGWKDRLFLTAAVRGDDSSAFGSAYDAALYPKLSATWVVTEEPFWGIDQVSALRLRAAWGQAGRQPNEFAAVTLYEPEVAVRGAPGIAPRILGNPDVGPEVSTELEMGFDAAFFEHRISSQFTYYRQEVTDALLETLVAPSSGFPGYQSRNLGELSNWGWELAVMSDVVQADNLGLELGLTVAHNRNRIDDLGGRLATSSLREGFPFPSLTARVITHAEWADEPGGAVTNVLCDGGTGLQGRERGGASTSCETAPELLLGGSNPLYEWSFSGTLRLRRDVRVSATAELRHGDYWRTSDLVGCRHWCFPNSRVAIVRDDPIWVAANSGAPFDQTNLYNSVYQAGFGKLREVSVSYALPSRYVARLGASSASFSVAGRELWTFWRKQETISGAEIPDPEMGSISSTSTVASVPPLTSFVATLRMSF